MLNYSKIFLYYLKQVISTHYKLICNVIADVNFSKIIRVLQNYSTLGKVTAFQEEPPQIDVQILVWGGDRSNSTENVFFYR